MSNASQRTRFTVGVKIGVGFAIALAMLLLVGLVSRQTSQTLLDSSRWVNHTQQVLGHIWRMTAQLRTTEADARGYALTAEGLFASALVSSRSSVRSELASLIHLTTDNPRQTARFTQLNALMDRKLQLQERIVNLRDKEGVGAAARLVSSDENRMLMDSMGKLSEAAEKEERDLLAAREVRSRALVDNADKVVLWLVIFGVALVAMVGVLIGRDITRSVQVREAMINAIRDATQQLGSATSELLAAATQQGAGSQEQAAAIAETATTAEQIAQTAAQAAERIRSVAEASQRSAQATTDGKRAVDETVARISALKERVGQMAENILQLAEHAQSIQELTSTVSDLAEQSNILALNAAIEASRAGEHGRGFSVVAGEVREIAEQSKKATKQVTSLLGEMQRQTNRAVMITEEGTKSADKAVQAVAEAGEMFGDIALRVSDSAQAAIQVAASASQQALGVSQIQQAMRDINQVTTQSLASTRQIERASRDLSVLSTRLRDMLGSENA